LEVLAWEPCLAIKVRLPKLRRIPTHHACCTNEEG
jgi:hypothetical protein